MQMQLGRRFAVGCLVPVLAVFAGQALAQDLPGITQSDEPLPQGGNVDPTVFASGGICAPSGAIGSATAAELEALATSCCSISSEAVFDIVATAQAVLAPELVDSFTSACLLAGAEPAAGPAPAAGPVTPAAAPGLGPGPLDSDNETTLGGPPATPI